MQKLCAIVLCSVNFCNLSYSSGQLWFISGMMALPTWQYVLLTGESLWFQKNINITCNLDDFMDLWKNICRLLHVKDRNILCKIYMHFYFLFYGVCKKFVYELTCRFGRRVYFLSKILVLSKSLVYFSKCLKP